MKFTGIFKKSWEDYIKNFRSIFNFVFLFSLTPLIILSVVQWVWSFFDRDLLAYLLNPLLYAASEESFIPHISFFIFSTIFGIISLFLLFFIYAGLTSASLKKSIFTLKDLVSEGRIFYFKYLGFAIVSFIFLSLLFLLLIIPSIIFLVYWILGVYVYCYEKKSLLKSLKRSRELIKGRWWKVFGYILLVSLLMLFIYLFAFLITLPIAIYTTMLNLNGISSTINLLVISSLLNILSNFLVELIALPLFILFFKNLYLELKG